MSVCLVPNIILFLHTKNIFSALPEDEWFLDSAKTAIHKLMLGTSGSESDLEAPIVPHDEISDSEESTSTASTVGSEDSFASANNDDLESPVYFTEIGRAHV